MFVKKNLEGHKYFSLWISIVSVHLCLGPVQEFGHENPRRLKGLQSDYN